MVKSAPVAEEKEKEKLKEQGRKGSLGEGARWAEEVKAYYRSAP